MIEANSQELINYLTRSGALKTTEIIKAFSQIDRGDFVPQRYVSEADGDYPLPIGSGQTISQPSTVAFMLELLQAEEGNKILDVGSGSGWTTALLAKIVGAHGFVFATEVIPELVEFARENLQKYGIANVKILLAGERLGLVDQAPFDRILVSAAGRDLPQELVEQLKVGGRMVIPILDAIWKIEKISEDEIKQQRYSGFAFVPLKY